MMILTNHCNEKRRYLAYVPCFYYLLSRVVSLWQLLRILLTEHFIITLYIISQMKESLILILEKILLAYILFYSIYEIGYIINDATISKYEDTPTTRVIANYINIYFFILIRIFPVIAILFLMSWSSWSLYGSLALLIYIGLHNILVAISSPYRVYTFLVLRILRYIYIPLLILGRGLMHVVLPTVLLLPVIAHESARYVCLKIASKYIKRPTIYQQFLPFLPFQMILLTFLGVIRDISIPLIYIVLIIFISIIYEKLRYYLKVKKIFVIKPSDEH